MFGIPWLDPVTLILATGPWALAAVCFFVFAESGLLIGFFLPGDSLVFMTGLMVSATAGYPRSSLAAMPLWAVAGAISLAAFIGDQTGYYLGERAARLPAVERRMSQANRSRLDRARDFFERYGGPAIILARFVPIIRTFTPFAVGLDEFPRRRFIGFNAIGALLWGVGVTLAGYYLGNVPLIADHIEAVLVGIVVLSVLPIVIKLASGALAHRGSTVD